jgi:Protein of unknown function (DUF1570)
MKTAFKVLLAIIAIWAVYAGRNYWLEKNGYGISAEKVRATATKTETLHYEITSTATPKQTMLVAEAVEVFYSAYTEFFSDVLDKKTAPIKLKLVLYKNRQEFSVNNKSSPWAEAYYRAPICYAYYSETTQNPYHWMIHEATHQLNNELAHLKTPKWINEGLASYFGASKIENRTLIAGSIDASTYPIWWLSSMSLSGNLDADIADKKIIPLEIIISGNGGPNFGRNVNLYYLEFWSLTHFLFHYKNGVYADSYKKLIVEGGSLENFERIIGPTDKIQREWYDYLEKDLRKKLN